MTKLKDYETVLIIHPDVTDDGVNALIEKLREVLAKHTGEILRDERWGKRKLSFEVKSVTRGNFVLVHYTGNAEAPAEFERTLRNDDKVLRYLTTVNGYVTDIAKKKAEVEALKGRQPPKSFDPDAHARASEREGGFRDRGDREGRGEGRRDSEHRRESDRSGSGAERGGSEGREGATA